jgi:hypothetical protein
VKLWTHCPTCKQQFTGAVQLELSRACWELRRNRPEADIERLAALGNLACALSATEEFDGAAARLLYEELVAVKRRTMGDGHPATFDAIGRLGCLLLRMDDNAGAQPLLEEALAGLRLAAVRDDDAALLRTMHSLAAVYDRMGATGKARFVLEEILVVLRRTQPAEPHTFVAINNLSGALMQAGDSTAALALREEAAASALRVLGPDHPCTQQMTTLLAQTRQIVAQHPSGICAFGTLVGLASKPELNNKQVAVVGFDAAKGRYRVRHPGNMHTGKPIGIKPENLLFGQASAVIVEGLDAAPEWNSKRGLVESYDAAKGRYRLLVKGRTKPLGVKVACCKLEFAAEQEHEATRRARVPANVRAALAAREPEAGAASTS